MPRQLKNANGVFLEIIIAPKVTDKALEILTHQGRKEGFLSYHLTLKMLVKWKQNTLVLVVSRSKPRRGESPAEVATKRQPTETEAKKFLRLGKLSLCEIKWYYRDQRPYDTWCWPRSNQPYFQSASLLTKPRPFLS